jgi:hypothetical protein
VASVALARAGAMTAQSGKKPQNNVDTCSPIAVKKRSIPGTEGN